MSADNWTICPRCAKKLIEDKERLELQVEDSYGKILANEYLELLDKSNKVIDHKHTLREDYWMDMDIDGIFEMSYGCSCNVCDFSFKFKHREQSKI